MANAARHVQHAQKLANAAGVNLMFGVAFEQARLPARRIITHASASVATIASSSIAP